MRRHVERVLVRRDGRVRRHTQRVLVRFPLPRRSSTAGPAAPLPPPERHTVFGLIVADLSVLQLTVLGRRMVI